ncbi:MAG: hypothetical protein Q7U52_09965 [Hydrogenophaga sp.]|nr:hypothetical protein [Hydrogenophaga sp.]
MDLRKVKRSDHTSITMTHSTRNITFDSLSWLERLACLAQAH